MKQVVLGAVATGFLVTGCTVATENTKPGEPIGTVPKDTCNAVQYRKLIGQSNPAITLPKGTVSRFLKEGDPMTMDFKEGRINFIYDNAGQLIAVTCG